MLDALKVDPLSKIKPSVVHEGQSMEPGKPYQDQAEGLALDHAREDQKLDGQGLTVRDSPAAGVGTLWPRVLIAGLVAGLLAWAGGEVSHEKLGWKEDARPIIAAHSA
jgi:hypothetical protein